MPVHAVLEPLQGQADPAPAECTTSTLSRCLAVQHLDLSTLPPARRPLALAEALDALRHGEAFEFSTAEDPAPLYYRCDRARPGQASWQYLRCGPDGWTVRVTRR